MSNGLFGRLYRGETSFDFFGRRRIGFALSTLLIVVTVVSLLGRGLNLGIDFEGGVAWQVPASAGFGVDDARAVVDENGVETSNAKIQTLSSGSGEFVRIQVGDQPLEVRESVQKALAEAAGVEPGEVSVSSVSSSWGRSITEKAVRALAVFLVLVALYIAWRFEWRMALAAIAAMIHDVLVSVGIYAVFGFEVTPATVVAFLTILGFSLYDTIVVFDKVRENLEKFSGSRTPVADIVNVSMNQVLMRSLNTSLAAVLPVLSLLVLGAGVFGAVALREFAVALLVGMITGAYSSIYIATPLLASLKQRESRFRNLVGSHARGSDLAHLVTSGLPSTSRSVRAAANSATNSSANSDTRFPGTPSSSATDPSAILSHPPRPRKKRRR
ncbi:MAG: protein translocase subunit SecF [Ilumatobacteraceae bacterium]